MKIYDSLDRCPKCHSKDFVFVYKNKFNDKPSKHICLACDYEEIQEV